MSRSYQLWKNDVEVIIIFLFSLLLLWKTGIFWTLNKFLSTTLCWMALKGWYSKSAFNFWSNDIWYVYVNWKMKAPYFFHKKVPAVPRQGPRSSNLVLHISVAISSFLDRVHLTCILVVDEYTYNLQSSIWM